MMDGLLIGGISITILISSKFKFVLKKNGHFNLAIGCQDKPLVDEDDFEIRQTQMGEIHVLYVKPKHAVHEHKNGNSDSE